jgi:acetoin utilization deacetylase AcuC-like enzyme
MFPTMLGFCSSEEFVHHDTGPYHPERPDRIRAIARAVRQAGLVHSPDPFPDFQITLGRLPVLDRPPLRELQSTPADESWLLSVHDRQYLDHVRHICHMGGGVLDQGDTLAGPESYDVARAAAGAVLRCCQAVAEGEVRRAFAAVRPPGHHAESDTAMGFCLFSNIAIGARYLQRHHGLERIAIVDFDVHHGNGTQAIFEQDPTVLFISMHQHPRTIFPRSGYEWEIGLGAGEGTVINLPFDPGAEDEQYLHAMHARVLPELDRFRPEAILISAGFDAHADDPLGRIELSDAGFEEMTRLLVQCAEVRSGGRIVSALEGGYNLRALGRCVVRHLEAMNA